MAGIAAPFTAPVTAQTVYQVPALSDYSGPFAAIMPISHRMAKIGSKVVTRGSDRNPELPLIVWTKRKIASSCARSAGSASHATIAPPKDPNRVLVVPDLDALPAVIDLQRRYERGAAFPGKAARMLTRLAVKEGTYLRGFVYSFIEMLVPGWDKRRLEEAFA